MNITRRSALKLGVGAGVVGALGLGASQFVDFSPQLSEGRSRARAIETDTILPEAVDVVIIGGGNLGTSAAYFLARNGLKVALCEKGAIAGEASGRSVGFVYSTGLPDDDMVFAGRSKEIWAGINQELGIDTGYRQTGLMQRIDDEAGVEYWKSWLERFRPATSNARILSSSEVASLVDGAPKWHAAVYDPTDGGAEPPLVAPAFAEAARRLGAVVIVNCAVRGVETAGGKVSGVVTEMGTIRTSQVVLAGGSWSSRFLGNMDVKLPLVDAFMWLTTGSSAYRPGVGALFGDLGWRQQIDGNFTLANSTAGTPLTPSMLRNFVPLLQSLVSTGEGAVPRLGSVFFEELGTASTWKMDEISPFERRRILEPALNLDVMRLAYEGVRGASPKFGDLKLGTPWSGVMSPAVDFRPVVGKLSAVPGLTVATGMLGGLAIGPAVGEAVADLVMNRQTRMDLAAYTPDRFA